MTAIRVVVPNGSMKKTVELLLERAGLIPVIEDSRLGEGHFKDVDWVEMVAFQRPYNIPQRLARGQFDLGIVGQDWIANWGLESQLPVQLVLPIARSSNQPVGIVLAVKEGTGFDSAGDLPEGCTVATEYEALVRRFFDEIGRDDVHVSYSPGDTEDRIDWGEADAVVDVVESGASLRARGLKVIHKLMDSSTVIVANPRSLQDEEKATSISCFTALLRGAYQASTHVVLKANVPKGVLNEAAEIMGGLKGPTCSIIFGNDKWMALESVVEAARELEVLIGLRALGVTGIIVNRTTAMIMS